MLTPPPLPVQATSSLSHLAYQGSTPVFPPPGSHSRPYFPQFTTPTQFRPPTDMSVPALSHTPPPNFDSDIIVLSDSSGDETEPESSTSSPLMFPRRWRHAPLRAEEGAELRSHSPLSVLSGGPPLSVGGRAPIPTFSISPSRRASLPGEATPERHRADRQVLDDAELARRLQVGVVLCLSRSHLGTYSTYACTGFCKCLSQTTFNSRLTFEFDLTYFSRSRLQN